MGAPRQLLQSLLLSLQKPNPRTLMTRRKYQLCSAVGGGAVVLGIGAIEAMVAVPTTTTVIGQTKRKTPILIIQIQVRPTLPQIPTPNPTRGVPSTRTYPRTLAGPAPSIGRRGGALHTAPTLWCVSGSMWWHQDNEPSANLASTLHLKIVKK